MRANSLKTFRSILLAIIPALICSHVTFGQAGCLSGDDIKAILAKISSSSGMSLNKELRDKLLSLKEKAQQRVQHSIAEGGKSEAMFDRMRAYREENMARLCPVLKEFGWPGADLVGPDGVAAAFYLLKNSSSFALQRDLLPVIIAATKKGEIAKADFAGFLDRLRLSAGLKQLFGTQATIRNGFLVLFPIEDEARVDARRKQYDLSPLSDYIRGLEITYGLPLVKSPGKMTNEFAETPNAALARTGTSLFEGQPVSEDEVIRVETNLVNLNVSVYSNKSGTRVSSLEQKDFAVFEDGHEEPVTFFATTDAPFDLILLIDLSGSTSDKRDLIRKTTRRFIEAARPSDRLAIVTFSDTVDIVSPLTSDHQQLFESIKKIKGGGSSHVWDALKFTLDQIVGPKTSERRRAVVFMTDGVDNSLMGFPGRGSEIDFSDLLEIVRRSDALIIPIYLDTEGDNPGGRRIYENARNTLAMLADESGGLYYRARKVEDLSGVYAQVIDDLGKVYSLGYKPTNEKHDGSWREVKIRIRNRPDLSTRARPGYYAK